MALKTAFSFEWAVITDLGHVRKSNEDAYLVDADKGIFLIADGMGGRKAGEVASQHAVDHLYTILSKSSPAAPLMILERGFQETNQQIYKEAKENEAYFGMGTTLLALLLSNSTAFYAHVGDSRLYLFRSGKLQLLTSDHSLVNDLVAVGEISKEQAQLSGAKHILSMAVGTHPKVKPSLASLSLQANDLFLLATDGLTNLVPDIHSEKILNKNISTQEKAQALVELAKINGGTDNITVLLVQINDLSR